MCNKRSYTPYQRSAIKGIAKIVGETPFRYEKSSNNHLKVTIKGIDQVFFTSSTPSDHRSLENFLAEIRCAYKQKHRVEPSIQTEIPRSVRKANAKKASIDAMGKVTEQLIKVFRNSLESFKEEEMRMVESSQTEFLGENIQAFRKRKIRAEIDRAIKSFGTGIFIPPGLIKQTQKQVGENLNFMLPTVPEYDRILSLKSGTSVQAIEMPEGSIQPEIPEDNQADIASTDPQQEKNPTQDKAANDDLNATSDPSKTSETVIITKPHISESASSTQSYSFSHELADMTKRDIRQLIADCQRLLDEKHQADIQFLVSQMHEREVDLAELQTALLRDPV
jgi:cell wall assembly regulator SMI1